jgi:hypothetical protein
MSKQTRAELAAIRAKLSGVGDKPVDLAWWFAGVADAVAAHKAGREYSVLPPKNPGPPSPEHRRLLARYDGMATALAKEGGK